MSFFVVSFQDSNLMHKWLEKQRYDFPTFYHLLLEFYPEESLYDKALEFEAICVSLELYLS